MNIFDNSKIVKYLYRCRETGLYYDGWDFRAPVPINKAEVQDMRYFLSPKPAEMSELGYDLEVITMKELFYRRLGGQ